MHIRYIVFYLFSVINLQLRQFIECVVKPWQIGRQKSKIDRTVRGSVVCTPARLVYVLSCELVREACGRL